MNPSFTASVQPVKLSHQILREGWERWRLLMPVSSRYVIFRTQSLSVCLFLMYTLDCAFKRQNFWFLNVFSSWAGNEAERSRMWQDVVQSSSTGLSLSNVWTLKRMAAFLWWQPQWGVGCLPNGPSCCERAVCPGHRFQCRELSPQAHRWELPCAPWTSVFLGERRKMSQFWLLEILA